LAGERTDHALPTHFYLLSDVRRPEDLEDADFLLTTHPRAPAALDLLLGTQGWRRFVPARLDEGRAREAPVLATDWDAFDPTPLVKVKEGGKGKAEVAAAWGRRGEHFRAEHEALGRRQTELAQEMSEARVSPAYLAARAKVASYAA